MQPLPAALSPTQRVLCGLPLSPEPGSAQLSSVQPGSASRWCCSAGNERPGGTYLSCTVSRLILEAGCTFLLLQKIIFWLLRGGKKKKVSLMMPPLIIQPPFSFPGTTALQPGLQDADRRLCMGLGTAGDVGANIQSRL